jgi:hypothetical protein
LQLIVDEEVATATEPLTFWRIDSKANLGTCSGMFGGIPPSTSVLSHSNFNHQMTVDMSLLQLAPTLAYASRAADGSGDGSADGAATSSKLTVVDWRGNAVANTRVVTLPAKTSGVVELEMRSNFDMFPFKPRGNKSPYFISRSEWLMNKQLTRADQAGWTFDYYKSTADGTLEWQVDSAKAACKGDPTYAKSGVLPTCDESIMNQSEPVVAAVTACNYSSITAYEENPVCFDALCTVRVFDRNLHSRMSLVPTPARLKLLQACV